MSLDWELYKRLSLGFLGDVQQIVSDALHIAKAGRTFPGFHFPAVWLFSLHIKPRKRCDKVVQIIIIE